jgi:putative tricarboxylic transport membrane protein
MNRERISIWHSCKSLTMCSAVALIALMAASPRASAWTPPKPVEFVVQAAPGGGSDVLARTMASIIEAEKLSPVPFVIINKPGGGSVVGTTYVAQQKNPGVIATYHSGNLVAPITAGVEIARANHLTMLANLAVDEQMLVVRSDSPFTTVKEMVAAAKKAPSKPFNVGGTTPAQDDEICNALLERAANIKLRYISFNSGGEAMTALLGGHVDMIWANPSEFVPQAEAKQVRPLAVAKEGRLPFMKDVPTFKEEGFNVTWKMFRGIVAPPRISADAITFYETTFKKMSSSARWKEGYIDKYMLTPMWMGHEQFAKFVPEQEQIAVGVLKQLGLVK